MSIGLWCGLSADTRAQIVPDGTLDAESSVLTPRQAGGTQIEGGAMRGESLFHSFTAFNVNAGEQVFFASPVNIEAIVGRVTGSDISDISGTLGVDGMAGLYLLNPNGFIFGPAARLDIPGSFVASTATQLELGNGVDFSAIAPDALPMLTVSVPLGLQPGQALSGEIVSRSDFLEVGGDLSLAASTIELQGGQIGQGEGAIHLRAIESIKLQGNSAADRSSSISTSVSFGTSGNAGDVLIETGRLVLEDGATISSTTNGNGDGGNLTIRASESMRLSGRNSAGAFSSIAAIVQPSAVGDAGDILIETGYLVLEDGAQIIGATAGDGNAGNLSIQLADSVELRGQNSFGGPSAIAANAWSGSTGDAGDIFIDTGHLILEDGAAISSETLGGEGDAGDLMIQATASIELYKGAILTGVRLDGIGDAGNLLIETGRLVLEDESFVSSSTSVAGDAGSVTIRAIEAVELNDSFIVTDVGWDGIGDAGDLLIETDRLVLENRSGVSSSTTGEGDGANLVIRATESITLEDGSIATLVRSSATGNAGNIAIETRWLSMDNGVFSTASEGTGNAGELMIAAKDWLLISGNSLLEAVTLGGGIAGSLTVTTQQLTVKDDGQLAVSAEGGFPAGTLVLNADLIELNDNASLRAETAIGNDGDIELNVRGLLLRDNSSLSTDASEAATGGHIIIDASSFVLLLENSSLVARAVAGQGGDIEITTQAFLQSDGSQIDASSDLGVDGTVSLDVLESNLVTELGTLPTDFDNAEMDQRCAPRHVMSETSRFVQTGRGGLASDADASNRAGLWVDMRSGELDEERPYRDISIQTTNQESAQIVEAQGWSLSPTGQVMLTADTTVAVLYGALPSAANCQNG